MGNKADRILIHVLVVDDHEDSRDTAVDYLKALGFEQITAVQDGREALVALEEEAGIGLILSDWDMPTVDGLTLLKRVRANPKWAHIPFIIMSSPRSTEHEKIGAAIEDLVDDYIVKPFRIDTLEQKLDKTFAASIHGPQKICVVADDDPDSRETVVEYLQRFGFKRIEAFPDGESAMKFMSEHITDIGMIIADWEMPKVKGVELLELCKRTKALGDVPFFIITSQASIERMKVMQAASLHVDNYLLKPFTQRDLKDRIDRTFSKIRFEREINASVEKGFEDLERGRAKAALMNFQKALKLNPEFDMGLSGMGDAIFRTKTAAEAIPYYQKALAINPGREIHYIKLSRAYDKKDEFGKATNILTAAMNNLAPTAAVHLELARLYMKKEMYRKAVDALTEAIKIEPDNTAVGMLLIEAKQELENGRKKGGT
ncbi:MAG: response regulator [Bdellovibrionales bacterium]|nr:response regulator [Bdellovibrionales bacterium]